MGIGGQGVGLHCRPYRVLRGSGGRPTESLGVKWWAYGVPGGQGVGLEGPRGTRGRPRGSQGVKG